MRKPAGANFWRWLENGSPGRGGANSINQRVSDDQPHVTANGSSRRPENGVSNLSDADEQLVMDEGFRQSCLAIQEIIGSHLRDKAFLIPPRNIQALRDGKSYVYFIGGDETPIKIGFSSQPYERLTILQTAHWCKLSILAKIEGDLSLEKHFHARFAAYRLCGEWFAREAEILAEIERINQGHCLSAPSDGGVGA